MDITKLRPLNEKADIITTIDRASSYGGEMWQTIEGERRLVAAEKIELDLTLEKLILKASSPVELDKRSPLFIRLNYRNIIFRLDPEQYSIMGHKFICDMPDQAQALEPRKYADRYALPLKSDISLTLRKGDTDLEVRIIDVSECGFGIIISGGNKDYLRAGDHITVKAIDRRVLNKYITAQVCYVVPKGSYLKRGDVRVGLSLQTTLSDDIFEKLKKKSHKVLSA